MVLKAVTTILALAHKKFRPLRNKDYGVDLSYSHNSRTRRASFKGIDIGIFSTASDASMAVAKYIRVWSRNLMLSLMSSCTTRGLKPNKLWL
jgi:hypothetical protein